MMPPGIQTSPREPAPGDPQVELLLAGTEFSPIHRDWLPERDRWLKERCASLRVSGLGAHGASRVRVLLLNALLGVSFYPAVLDFLDALRRAQPELEVVSASYFDDIHEYGEGVAKRGVRVVKTSEVMGWSADKVNDFDLVIAVGASDALAKLMTLEGVRSRLVLFDFAFYHQLIESKPEFYHRQKHGAPVKARVLALLTAIAGRYGGRSARPPSKVTAYTSQPFQKVSRDLAPYFPARGFDWHRLPYIPIGFGRTEFFRAAEPTFDVALLGTSARDYTLLDPSRLRGVRFLFIGDIGKVPDLAALRSAGDITVLPDLKRDDYAKIIALCRCAVIPLCRASMNALMSVVDVLASGVPLVATASVGFEALIRTGAPVVFHGAASEAMTTELLDLLADEPRRRTLSARSIAFARQHLDIYRMLDQILQELGAG
jgi:glycosyltransferase involved in cell wall biosynthesis